MKLSIEHNTLKTNPGKSCSNGEPIGIAHLASFNNYLVVNNIDHNTEISKPTKSQLNPIATYNQTVYPDHPEDAGFDLDIHAVFYQPKKESLSMLNHYGRLRFFDLQRLQHSTKIIDLRESTNILWIADSEQCLLVNDCLVATSPGDYHVPSPGKPGLFISSPLSGAISSARNKGSQSNLALEYSVFFANRGTITAIAINSSENLLALAVGPIIIIAAINKFENGGVTIDKTIAEFQINFHCTFLSFFEENLIAAGHDLDFKEDVFDPSSLKGGGFALINTTTHKILSSTAFNQNLAWGNGSLCLTVVSKHNSFAVAADFKESKTALLIMGLDRNANLWAWQPDNEEPKSLIGRKSSNEQTSYGIGHLTWCDGVLFCGFNRDGDRLHRYEVTTV